ncbi:MAG: hypothetical protein AAGD14_00520 [Planctomycetota bacterium]
MPALDDIDGALVEAEGAPRLLSNVAWDWVQEHVEEAERGAVFEALVLEWLARLCPALGPAFRLARAPTAWLVTDHEEAWAKLLVQSAQESVRAASGLLDVQDRQIAIVVALSSRETYYDYLGYYYPEQGEFAESAGVYVGQPGVAHVVLGPSRDITDLEVVLAHEIGHLLTFNDDAPAWIMEGVAQICEERILIPWGEIDRDRAQGLARVIASTEFRSGDSFDALDETRDYSY